MRLPVVADVFRLHHPLITDPAAPVFLRVGVQQLLPSPRTRQPDAIAVAHHRREVEDDDHSKSVQFPWQHQNENIYDKIGDIFDEELMTYQWIFFCVTLIKNPCAIMD